MSREVHARAATTRWAELTTTSQPIASSGESTTAVTT